MSNYNFVPVSAYKLYLNGIGKYKSLKKSDIEIIRVEIKNITGVVA
jgi:hypothetical protein